MPELPEVQTVLDTLALRIKDRQIKDIDILYAPIVDCKTSKFKKALIGQHFKEFQRRGKYLLFVMDNVVLVSHLRMEGKYYIQNGCEEIKKHTHVIFYLDNGQQLRYNDVRKFGRMELMEKKDNYDEFKNLGPEPFSEHFNRDYVKKHFFRNNKPLKEMLLDQSFIAGIGNIYADEICFACGIRPTKHVSKITFKEIDAIIYHTQRILNGAIKAGGTTIRSYTSSLGVTGLFQLKLKIHTQKECAVCQSSVKKTRVGGRGTYYCPRCQKV